MLLKVVFSVVFLKQTENENYNKQIETEEKIILFNLRYIVMYNHNWIEIRQLHLPL